MGPAPARLKRRRDFLRVAGTRRKWVAPGLILQLRPHDAPAGAADRAAERIREPIRVGFTVSRKVGGAVVRNRARRRLLAVVETVMPEHAARGNDYVVIGRAATVRRPFQALTGDLETALKRLGAWRDGAGGGRNADGGTGAGTRRSTG
jgi:ribonuclease P protein component